MVDKELDTRNTIEFEFIKAYHKELPRSKFYSKDHIFNEEMSVKWNREEVIRQNESLKEARLLAMEERAKAVKEAHNAIIGYLCTAYPNISNETVAKLYHYIFNDNFCDDYRIDYVIDTCLDILGIFSGEDV